MDKILNKLALIPNDKLLHSFYGTILYVIVSCIDSLWALIIVIITAVLKELYDEVKYGGFDYKDIIATIAIPIIIYLKELEKV